MKEFADLRTQLSENIEEEVIEEHITPQGGMPPNILILRRKSVRQFPNETMVALYYNDKLDQYFSIPYGASAETTITPSSLKEDVEKETSQQKELKRHASTVTKWNNRKKRWLQYKVNQSSMTPITPIKESVIDHLRQVKDFKTSAPVKHADGTKTKVDPTTASALLTVHDALQPEHQKVFAGHLEHSKPKFHKMLDFTWKQVK